MTFRKIPLTFLIVVLGVTCAYARKQPKYEQARLLTPEQSALVNRAVAQEKVLIRDIKMRTPLVETYIQNTRPDQKLYEVPVDDQYILSRVDFGKAFFDKGYEPRQESKHGFFKGSLGAITGLTKLLGLEKFTYSDIGFMQMMFIDPTGFDQQHYVFSFVRREFLGNVRTWVFDVHPRVAGMGRFYGRIWIEDEGSNVVRFNGTYTGPTNEDSSKYYFHFDSWRMNVQPGIWLPVAVYVEETQRIEGSKSVGLKAQTHFWGYSLKLPTRDSENVSVKVDDAVDRSNDSQDVGPLQASRMWVTQAENNVIDRLVEAGLVAPLDQGGYETKVLDQIVINLVVPNNLAFTDQIHTRVMLTDTIEATTVGNTILLSRGLIDSLPSEEAIASVIAMELAHIAWATISTPATPSTTACCSPTSPHSSALTCTTPMSTMLRLPKKGDGIPPGSPCTKTGWQALGLYPCAAGRQVQRSSKRARTPPKMGYSAAQSRRQAFYGRISPAMMAQAGLGRRSTLLFCRWAAGSKPSAGTSTVHMLARQALCAQPPTAVQAAAHLLQAAAATTQPR